MNLPREAVCRCGATKAYAFCPVCEVEAGQVVTAALDRFMSKPDPKDAEIAWLRGLITDIQNTCQEKSTGPAVWDDFWELRRWIDNALADEPDHCLDQED